MRKMIRDGSFVAVFSRNYFSKNLEAIRALSNARLIKKG
jgi:hypothetical protein